MSHLNFLSLIVGDTLYAPPAIAALASRLLLHASALALAHPITEDRLERIVTRSEIGLNQS